MVEVEKLTKHLRLMVYSYLDLQTALSKISTLSKLERTTLRDSAIARKGKNLVIAMNERTWPRCLLHSDRL